MDNAEPEDNSSDSDDEFLIEPEMDDYGWLLPIDAPRDMDAELQWWLTSQRLEMQEPLLSPAPMPIEESDSECEIIDADPPPRLKMARPPGIPWEHYTDRIHYSRVARVRPEQEHRIITEDADFTDHITYTEIPIRREPYGNPNLNEGQQEPLWRITWRCYGLTEDTVEKQSLLEEHYPALFY
ncbi:hypothetical protein RHGRI_011286 [Rhododendron griersonianum]|uniref:Uncharacterized protein n=1 Tax=Rhododendron griersonianum TaxID=479676 RepID=A0AAV6KM85_9ERIC|nr:hypothetical protein RHGRI_011286 [Rhododendron griersonianum]